MSAANATDRENEKIVQRVFQMLNDIDIKEGEIAKALPKVDFLIFRGDDLEHHL